VINDTLGHHQGDVVLKAVAGLLLDRVRKTDLLCRIGGDEFALLLPNTTAEQGLHMASMLCNLVAEYHCEIEGQIFCLNCSIGVATIDGSEGLAEEYMKQADIALYAAKNQGRNLAHLYDDSDETSSSLKASLEWSRRLQQAVANDQLVLYFQPVVHVKTGQIGYYEALVRLVIDGEIIMPGDFIPPLERAGDMRLLDKQVISKAIKYLHDYPQMPRIAINLSAQGFSDEGLAGLIAEKLMKYDVSADRIIFELTESASLSNISVTSSTIRLLNQLGCGFSIDDFGTGFSTFNYLKRLPAQSVKIDGSFVVELANSPVDRALVKAIYEVATALDKYTVAEYVENHETLRLIREIGITYAQGYFLGRPMPVEALFA
jgi:diguanylate cyclase (GGDEF)-like protein